MDASSLNTIPTGPVEIRFGKRNAIVHLAWAIFAGFLGGGMSGHGTVGWKECQRQGTVLLRIKRLDRAAPTLPLTVVDLPQIEHRALHRLSTRATPAFHQAPVAMFLAVFEPPIALQIHNDRASYTKANP